MVWFTHSIDEDFGKLMANARVGTSHNSSWHFELQTRFNTIFGDRYPCCETKLRGWSVWIILKSEGVSLLH